MNRYSILSNVMICSLWFLGAPAVAIAQPADAVESAKRALENTRQPWYDAESDQLKPMAVEEMTEDQQRADWRRVKRPEWSWDWSWNWNLSWIGELFQYLAWAVLILLLALLIYALVRAFLNIDPVSSSSGKESVELNNALTDKQRIENLPIQLRTKKGDLLELARQNYEAEDFADAIVYLFSHRLLQLDKAGVLRLTKGKTNRQYVSELNSSRDLQNILGQTTIAFEEVFFGRHPLSRERFENCWNRNEQFQSIIQQVMS